MRTGFRPPGRADPASLRPVFQPQSVAVIGASRRMGGVGRAVLHNIVAGGYQGKVYSVNPRALHMEGVPCLPSVNFLPEPVDLAVLAVPPPAVPVVADACGRRGVGALVVITARLDPMQGADLLAACNRYGMRLVGPGSFGVAVPGIGLDATPSIRHPAPGTAGLMMQSDGTGFALADRLSRLGLGISSFAATGDAYDVSGQDVLRWWEQDNVTDLAVLCLDALGHQRGFADTARRVGRKMPILVLPGGSASARAQAEQSGLITCRTIGETVDLAALFGSQPVPEGPHVVLVSNTSSAAALAAHACARHGLTVHTLSTATRRRLRALVPPGSAINGPVNTTLDVRETSFRHCLELAAADEGTDAILGLVLPTAATGDLIGAIRAANVRIPLAAVVLDQAEPTRLITPVADASQAPASRSRRIPAYASPEAAVLALARATAYGAWRSRPAEDPGEPGESGLLSEDMDTAQGLKKAFLK
jgi:acyl-CoA synthetase (NDP forming)